MQKRVNESGLPSAKGFKLNNLMGSDMDPTQECKEAAWRHIGMAWRLRAWHDPGRARAVVKGDGLVLDY